MPIISVGVSAMRADDTRVSEILERADAACYEAKSGATSGREIIEALRRTGAGRQLPAIKAVDP